MLTNFPAEGWWLIAVILIIAMLPDAVAYISSHKKPARTAVNAECLVCTYVETCEDATAARSAAEGHHAANADHVLMLVRANG